MNRKVLAILCLMLAIACVFCACKSDEETGENEKETKSSAQTQQTQDEREETEEETQTEDVVADTVVDMGNGMTKVFTVKQSFMYYKNGGMCYRDSETNKYGVMSADGKHDTGAVYYKAEPTGDYYMVVLQQPENPENIDSVNSTGLIDAEGNEIIPAEYAVVKVCGNDRFYQVFQATEITENKDEMLVYLTSSMFSLTAGEGDTLYKGVWFIFDTQTGKTVEGVSGTTNYNTTVTGDLISYYNDAKERIKVNTKGAAFPADAQVFDNGSYYVKADQAVYDAFGKKLFDYDEKAYGSISYNSVGYYRCSLYADGAYSYVILDTAGNAVTPAFEESVTVYAQELLTLDKIPCDFDGNAYVEAEITSATQYGAFWYLRNYDTKAFYLLDENFELVYTGKEDDGVEFVSYAQMVSKEEDGQTLYYSFAEKDFVYKGYPIAYGYIRVENETGSYDLVNTHTGKTVLSGYSNYYLDQADGVLYIFAAKQNENWENIVEVIVKK